jgi:RNA polymerase nonessential primary-like sigma factor
VFGEEENAPMPTVNTELENTNAKFTADMVRTYLREIGRVPLLTREQEIVYGKQVQQMMTLLEANCAANRTWKSGLLT